MPHDAEPIESTTQPRLRYGADGLIPVVTCDHASGAILMQAWMNAEAVAKTLELGEAVYWSRSRQELWHKGATSGHIQKVHSLRTDCDQDCLLLVVEQVGPGCCHAGYASCFYREITGNARGPQALQRIAEPTYDPATVYRQ